MFYSCQTLFQKLFPTKWSLPIFIAYILLFVNQGILVKASQRNGNRYDYNTVTVVIGTEFIKLFICLGFYFKNKSLLEFFNEIRFGIRIGALYLIPAFLYCLYNNLAFINLANYDPTTYMILLQFRTVITGLFFQILLRKQLSLLQWFSLCLLTIGCIIKEMGRVVNDPSNSNFLDTFFSWNLTLVILQLLCSCFAGVYNEYLLKDNGASVHILIQNVFMYCDSILCNIFLLILTSKTSSLSDWSFVWKPLVVAIMINGAAAGITTSFFLKNLNSILKTFAATIEIMLSAILCSIFFANIIDLFTMTSIVIIVLAIYIYMLKPVQNVNNNHLKENHNQKNNLEDNLPNQKVKLNQPNNNKFKKPILAENDENHCKLLINS